MRSGVIGCDGGIDNLVLLLLGQHPLESVDLVYVVGEEANQVHGVVHGDCQRIGDGVRLAYGGVCDGVGKGLRIFDRLFKGEYAGMVVS